jgi:hypothetical protein
MIPNSNQDTAEQRDQESQKIKQCANKCNVVSEMTRKMSISTSLSLIVSNISSYAGASMLAANHVGFNNNAAIIISMLGSFTIGNTYPLMDVGVRYAGKRFGIFDLDNCQTKPNKMIEAISTSSKWLILSILCEMTGWCLLSMSKKGTEMTLDKSIASTAAGYAVTILPLIILFYLFLSWRDARDAHQPQANAEPRETTALRMV